MAATHVVATVFLECQAMYRQHGPAEMAPIGEVEFVNGIAAMSASGHYGPCRVAEAIIGHADLTLGARVRDVLEAQMAVGGGRFRGIRYGVAWDGSAAVGKYVSRVVPPHLVRDATFREGFAQLARLGLSFESWQYHPQLPDAIDLARAFPDTTMILNHVGGVLGVGPYARKRAEILAGWKKDMFELAKCPNVHVKLGGIGMTSFGFDFHERDVPPSSEELAAAWRQYVEPCIEGVRSRALHVREQLPAGQAVVRLHRAVECVQAHHCRGIGRGKAGALQRDRCARVPADGALNRCAAACWSP